MVNDHFLYRYSVLPEFARQLFAALIATKENNLFYAFVADHFIGQLRCIITNRMYRLLTKVFGCQLAGSVTYTEDIPVGFMSVYIRSNCGYCIHAGEYNTRGLLYYFIDLF